MVFIKKVEIRGFKSLGDKTVTLVFERGFNAITGPNGSGKSNILDSIIFCLGENNPKMLRVHKLNSLVYDGGLQAQKPTSMRVTVSLDNSDRRIPVDSDTVWITRELNRRGESVYYLSGRRVQKGPLSDMLDLAMITPHGLHVVPQGRVTQVSELAPEEKRRLIEELAGVAQFDEKKAEAMKQLHDADSRLQVALARIDEIRKRVSSLEGERNDQLRLRQLEDEIRWLKAVLASRNLEVVTRRKLEQQEKLAELASRTEKVQHDVEEVKNQTQGAETERSSLISTILGGEGGRHMEVQHALAKAGNEIKTLKAAIQDAQDVIKRADGSLPQLQKSRDAKIAEIRAVEERVLELSLHAGELERAQRDAERESKQLKRVLAKQEAGLSRASSTKDRLNSSLSRCATRIASLNSKIEAVNGRYSLVSEQLHSLHKKSESFLTTLSRLEGSIEELKRLKQLEKESLDKLEASLSSLKERRGRLDAEITGALSILDRARNTVLRYEIQRSIAKRLGASEFDVRKLEEIAEAGALDGYVGRIEDMISFDKSVERAILAAAGPWMKAILVTDLKAMVKVVETAKRLKLGRLTLIPLSEVSNSTRVTPPTVEGVVGNLSQFVAHDAELEGVVNFIFGDTLLVRSPQAAYIGSSMGFRSVSLAGDLFEARGAAFETGFTAKLDSLIELVHDEASLESIRSTLQGLQRMIAKRKADLAEMERQAKTSDRERLNRTLTMSRLDAELKNITRFAASYRRLKSSIGLKLTKLGRVAEELDAGRKRLTTLKTSVEAKVREYDEKIQQLDTGRLAEETRLTAEKRAAVAGLIEKNSAQLREYVTELTKLKANLQHILRPDLEHLNQQIRQLEGAVKEKRRVIEDGQRRLKELDEEYSSLKREEAHLLESTKRYMPLIQGFESRLKHLRHKEEELHRAVTRLEKERVISVKSIEMLDEGAQRIRGELLLYGYEEPAEYFPAAEQMLNQLVGEYEGLKGRVNLLADSQYKEVFSGYKNLSLRMNQLEAERNALVNFIESVEAEKKRVFIDTFQKIDREVRALFAKMTGGSAWLEIEDPDDVFSSGVLLMTQFPGKAARESESISGGEKAVASIGFILAIQSVNPSPLYLFDEIDAHLDIVNSQKLAEILQERAESAQIIVATLKDAILARASVIYGVYMADSVSRVIKYRPGVKVAVRSA